jgi:hypothetical protein
MERDWKQIAAGGENDWIAPDPKDPDVVWGGRVGRFEVMRDSSRWSLRAVGGQGATSTARR